MGRLIADGAWIGWLAFAFLKDIPHGVFADSHENCIQGAINSEHLLYIRNTTLLFCLRQYDECNVVATHWRFDFVLARSHAIGVLRHLRLRFC